MNEKRAYLECEKRWVYCVLMIVAGFYGGYAMVVRAAPSVMHRPAMWR